MKTTRYDWPTPAGRGATGTSPEAPRALPIEVDYRGRTILRTVLVTCVLAEVALFLLDWHVNYGRLIDLAPVRNLFNTTREDGLASWFGVTQTALAALTLWAVFVAARARGLRRGAELGWLVLALLFSYMAFDDGCELHERVGTSLRILDGRSADEGMSGGLLEAFPSYAWQVVFVPVFAAAGLFMLVFLWRQAPTRRARILLTAGILCFVAAVGLDFVEGLDEDHALNLNALIADVPSVETYAESRFDRDAYDVVRHFGKSVEETLEMLGMTLLWVLFLGRFMELAPDLRLRVASA